MLPLTTAKLRCLWKTAVEKTMAWGDIPWKCNFCASGSLSKQLLNAEELLRPFFHEFAIYLFIYPFILLASPEVLWQRCFIFNCSEKYTYSPANNLIWLLDVVLPCFKKKKLTILHMLLCLYCMPIHLSSRLKSHPIYLLSCGSCFISLNTLPLYPPPMFFHMIFNMKKLDSPHKVSELDSHTALKMWFFVLFSPWSLKLAP